MAIAGDLADAVEAQWSEEARLRRLNDPYPLPIAWSPAPEGLVESWPVVSAVAQNWPGGAPGNPADWAHAPADLVAQWSKIVHVFHKRVPTRRLVVLGEPGSGKTMLLIRLAQGLLAERAGSSDAAVPVIFPLASWNPAEQDLFSWMSARLSRDYIGLDQSAPSPYEHVSRARALIDRHLVLPILDGFDEMPASVRPSALDAINQSLPPGQGIVLSSRTSEFSSAVSAPGSISVKLAGAAGIQLQPLDPQIAGSYLIRDGGGDDVAKQRWQPVIQQLGTASPTGLALRTPLMLFMARTIFNPRPGELGIGPLPDPAALCDEVRFPNRQDVEQYLMSSFVPACYRAPRDGHLPWSTETAERTLTFLAHHLERKMNGIPDLEWWRLYSTLPRRWSIRFLWIVWLAGLGAPTTGIAGLIGGVTYSLTRGIASGLWGNAVVAITTSTLDGMVFGATFGFVAGTTIGIRGLPPLRARAPLTGVTPITSGKWSWNGGSTAFAIMIGIAVCAVISVTVGKAIAISAAVLISITGIIWGGLRANPADVTRAASPDALLRNERRITLRGGIALAVLDGALTGVVVAVLAGNIFHSYIGSIANLAIVGLAGGTVLGIVAPSERFAWWSFTVTRWYLALHHGLPRDLMGFLRDAHQRRGVLRQIAGVYQFRHLDLQRSLAYEESTPGHVTETAGGSVHG